MAKGYYCSFDICIGDCAGKNCEATGIPVASDDYYTYCASCFREIADELDKYDVINGKLVLKTDNKG